MGVLNGSARGVEKMCGATGRREIPLRGASEVVRGPFSARIAPFPTSPGPKLGANRAYARARLPTSSYLPSWHDRRSDEDPCHQLRHFARVLRHRDPCGPEGVRLGGGGPLRPRDQGTGVAHPLAWRGGEAGDVGDDRGPHPLSDERRCLLLFVAADLADEHDGPGAGVALEAGQAVDESGTDDGVAADADTRRLPDAGRRQLVDDLVGEGAGARNQADRAGDADLAWDDAEVGLA